MFGNLIKKLVPVAVGAAAAYTGANMLGGTKLWASSTLTNKFKEKIGKEAIKKGFKSISNFFWCCRAFLCGYDGDDNFF